MKVRRRKEYHVNLQKAELEDSKGQKIQVTVVGLSDLVAGKIHKFFAVRNGIDTTKDRHSSTSDYFDLKRLLALKQINKGEVIKKLVKDAGSSKQALDEYDFACLLMGK